MSVIAAAPAGAANGTRRASLPFVARYSGERLAVEGRRRVGGVPCLIVRLPDGTPGTVEVAATSAAAVSEPSVTGALLSVEGVRQLRGQASSQVPNAEVCLVTSTPLPPGSALILRAG